MKKLIIMRGMSGCGKSTKAAELHLAHSPSIVLSTDEYWESKTVFGKPDVSQLNKAHGWNFRRMMYAVAQGYETIIIDNTNTTVWEFENYVHYAVLHDFEVEIFDLNPTSLDAAIAAAQRNIHHTPLWKCLQQWDRFEKKLPDTFNEGILAEKVKVLI